MKKYAGIVFALLFSMIMLTSGCAVWEKFKHDMEEEMTAPIDPETGEPVDIGNDAVDWDQLAGDLVGLGKTAIPSLAVAEGVLTLFSRRKRRHYLEAIKSVIPANGKVEIKDGVKSLGRAVGLAHSSTTTKEVFERAVAQKDQLKEATK